MRTSLLWTVLFLISLSSSPATAQLADHTVDASYRNAFLSDGDIHAQSVRLAGSYALHAWAGVAVQASYQFALTNDVRDAARGNWSDYQAALGDVSVYVVPLRIWTGTVGHRVRLSMGPAVRHQEREHPGLLTYPAAYEDGLVSYDTDYDRYYQERLEGKDLEQEGVYTLFTTIDKGWQLGGRVGAAYQLQAGRFIVGMDTDLHVLGGEKVFSYGLSLGLGW